MLYPTKCKHHSTAEYVVPYLGPRTERSEVARVAQRNRVRIFEMLDDLPSAKDKLLVISGWRCSAGLPLKRALPQLQLSGWFKYVLNYIKQLLFNYMFTLATVAHLTAVLHTYQFGDKDEKCLCGCGMNKRNCTILGRV